MTGKGRMMLYRADTEKNAEIAASASETFAITDADRAILRQYGAYAFNWISVVNLSSYNAELSFDGRTDKNVFTVPAKTAFETTEFDDKIDFMNVTVTNLNAANAIVANDIIINRRLVKWV